MFTYVTPGAYIEREDRAQGGINRLRTDIAAFVGIAERGPAKRAVAVESWKQFEAVFGSVFAHGYLAYVARAFFENGGRRCWIVRVQSDAAHPAALTLTASGATAFRLEASSAGEWGNALMARLIEVRRTVRRVQSATPHDAVLDSVAGIERATTIELLQESGGAIVREVRVVSEVDAVRRRIVWNNSVPEMRLLSDLPLATIDPARPARVETVAFQLQITSNGRLLRSYDDLSLVPSHARYAPKVVNGVAPLFTADAMRTAVQTVDGAESIDDLVTFGRRSKTGAVPEPVRLVELRTMPDALPTLLDAIEQPTSLTGGVDGLGSLTADDFIGELELLDDSDDAVKQSRYGIAALEEIEEISIVAVPDIHVRPRVVALVEPPTCEPNPCLPTNAAPKAKPARIVSDDAPPTFSSRDIERVSAALVSHCELRHDRIALLDPPFDASSNSRLGFSPVLDFRALFDTSYAALYFPWIGVLDPLPGVRSPVLFIPPCGHVAGQMAATDLRVGVHKAPANIPLLMAESTSFPIDETQHGVLNESGVNAIRAISGRGLRIAGARLVSSDTSWRFVNVRRLMLMIERSLETSTQWAVFEGNDWMTRMKLTLSIDSFLRELWSRGALMGAKAEEAYFVKCDEANNPSAARDRGELLVEIGVAPSIPYEFVVLRIGRTANGFSITESDEGAN